MDEEASVEASKIITADYCKGTIHISWHSIGSGVIWMHSVYCRQYLHKWGVPETSCRVYQWEWRHLVCILWLQHVDVDFIEESDWDT